MKTLLAKNVLDSIEFKFKLSTNQASELSEMRDYVDFINVLHDDDRNLAQLDSTEISFLLTMSNVPFGGIASERAENILCFFHDICKDPNPAPKSAATQPKKPKPQLDELLSRQNAVKTLPNPADAYIQLEISLLFSKERTFLNIFDIDGRKVQSRKIGDVNDTVIVLDTRKLTPGVYILEILQENKQIFTDKFVVQH